MFQDNRQSRSFSKKCFENTNEDDISPYDILGIPPDSSIQQIKYAYRELARALHPDKKGLYGNYFDNLNDIDRTYLFDSIQNAYKTLESQKCKESDAPSNDIQYDIQECVIPINDKLNEGKFIEIFNKLFIRETEDPNNLGHEDFNIRTDSTEYNEILKKAYNDNIQKNIHIKKRDLFYSTRDNGVADFSLKEIKIDYASLDPKNNNLHEIQEIKEAPYTSKPPSYEFGLTVIDDYSIKVSNLEGYDLDLCFDNKCDSIETKKIEKNNNDIENLLNDRKKERQQNLEFLSEEQEKQKKIKKEQIEQVKYRIQQKRDNRIYFLT